MVILSEKGTKKMAVAKRCIFLWPQTWRNWWRNAQRIKALNSNGDCLYIRSEKQFL